MSTTTSQQFEGTTIEEALAAAVEIFGDDLEIVDAQRVRRRKMLGVRRHERFEVTATRKPKAEPKGFEDVLARMVDRVDAAERSIGADLEDTDNDWWTNADFVVPATDDPPPRHGLPDAVTLDLSGGAEAARLGAPESVERAEAGRVPGSADGQRRSSSLDLRTPAGPSTSPLWSTRALKDLGLPAALVGRLRVDGLVDDLEWVAALAKAINELLETARPMAGPCELTGHGADSVVHLIRGSCDGFRIGSIVIEGRELPATGLELALAVRSLLQASSAVQTASPVASGR